MSAQVKYTSPGVPKLGRGTRREFPEEKTIIHFIRDNAEKIPDQIAIVSEENHITYRHLHERTDELAFYLWELGVGEDQTVGLLMERSSRMVECILAVWKTGGAYIPLETDYPPARILEIMEDSGSGVLVTRGSYVVPGLEGNYQGKILQVDAFQWGAVSFTGCEVPGPVSPDINMKGLAYVIYTSGSTGKPKGAMVEHIGMMNHIWAKIHDLHLTGRSILVQNASHTFDISVWQFFAALVVGGKILIYPNELIMEPEQFISRLFRDRVSVLEVVPSYLSILLDTLDTRDNVPLPLDYLVVTGEEVKPRLVRRWFGRYPHIKIVNAYGPTEASDDITHYIMNKAPEQERIPIGKPVQNLNIYILDENMNPCPIGVKGEIRVSGIGVGRGYLNNPELTFERFINYKLQNTNYKQITNHKLQITNKNKKVPGKRILLNTSFCGGPGGSFFKKRPLAAGGKKIYKTGDLGCWLPDGAIDFFGRKDHQVKIRGFRIELGEIERRLLDDTRVKDAVAVDREDARGNKYLCAYLVGGGEVLEMSAIKARLLEQLPDHMVPSYFMEIERIPLTPNGKVDREALPEPKTVSPLLIPYITTGMLKQVVKPGKKNTGQELAAVDEDRVEHELSNEEKEKILITFNDTRTPYPADKTIVELFAAIMQKRPDSIALVFEEEQITHAQLNLRAERLALRLRGLGVRSESIVGLMVERCLGLIIGILGILKAGGAYLPIDPAYPQERVKYMLEDTKVNILVKNSKILSEYIQGKPGIAMGHRPACSEGELSIVNRPSGKDGGPVSSAAKPWRVHSTNTAYVIYTSGSTGNPKGVMIENREVVNFITGITGIIDFNEGDVILSLITVSFDIFVLEALLPLTAGSRVVIGNTRQQLQPSAAGRVMQERGVTIFQATPSMMRMLVSDGEGARGLKDLKYLLVGGEALPQALLEKLREASTGRIYNMYGPTETTVWSTVKEVSPGHALNIGKPIANTQVYILSPGNNVQPVGVVGELCIGGEGVARGYLNQLELTAEKFCLRRPGALFEKTTPGPHKNFLLKRLDKVHMPSYHHASMQSRGHATMRLFPHHSPHYPITPLPHYPIYLTGDLARWLDDGNIEFLGRRDHQVQIRGIRVEPGEIESYLLRVESIKEAVVVVKRDDRDETYLSACIVSDQRHKEAELRENLSREIPGYMIPTSFVQLEKIPLMPNGKVDRTLLAAMETAKETHGATHDKLEDQLAEIWAEVLGIEVSRIGAGANFFQLGGDSLLSLQVVLKARQAGIGITSAQVFRYPGFEELAAAAKKAAEKTGKPSSPGFSFFPVDEGELAQLAGNNKGIRGVYPLTDIQRQMLSYHLLTLEPAATIMHLSWVMEGDLDIPAFEKAWQTAARRHCILRTAFKRRRLKEPVQLLYDSVTVPLQRLDYSGMTAGEQRQAVEDYIEADKKQRFKMSEPPLMRLCLVTLNNRRYRFICSYSSLLLDNWSSTIIVKEVFHFYGSYINNGAQAPPETPRPFVDYVQWLFSHDESEVREFWQRELEGFDAPVDLGIERPAGDSAAPGFTPDQREIRFLPRQVAALTALANKYRLTLGTVLQGAWIIALSFFSRQEDILSGVLSYGRPECVTGIDFMVGLFINTLPVRVKVPGNREVTKWLQALQDQQVRLRQFDYVSIEDISKWSRTALHKIQTAIYERTFVLVKSPGEEFLSGLSRNNSLRVSQYDDTLILNVPLRVYAELSEGVTIRLRYDRRYFFPETIDKMACRLESVLRGLLENPGVLLKDLKKHRQYKKEKTWQT